MEWSNGEELSGLTHVKFYNQIYNYLNNFTSCYTDSPVYDHSDDLDITEAIVDHIFDTKEEADQIMKIIQNNILTPDQQDNFLNALHAAEYDQMFIICRTLKNNDFLNFLVSIE